MPHPILVEMAAMPPELREKSMLNLVGFQGSLS